MRNSEKEFQVGMFRLPVPDYALEGFREAVNNAILHRDYTRLDHVYVQWHPDHILMANPGGFPEGVTLDNLLVHEPSRATSSWPKRSSDIGLIEQTGRGIDKIFYGQLRYGRPIPDYTAQRRQERARGAARRRGIASVRGFRLRRRPARQVADAR